MRNTHERYLVLRLYEHNSALPLLAIMLELILGDTTCRNAPARLFITESNEPWSRERTACWKCKELAIVTGPAWYSIQSQPRFSQNSGTVVMTWLKRSCLDDPRPLEFFRHNKLPEIYPPKIRLRAQVFDNFIADCIQEEIAPHCR